MKRTEVTYGQLDRALRSLGFSFRLLADDPPTRAYRHEAGALVMLPAFSEEDRVFEYHLASLRTQLENFGIADPSVLAAKLQKAK